MITLTLTKQTAQNITRHAFITLNILGPNLSTIAKKLHLSESMVCAQGNQTNRLCAVVFTKVFLCVNITAQTGVTFLAFGNGSPDVFSTFSAMGAGSASLAIGELVGE